MAENKGEQILRHWLLIYLENCCDMFAIMLVFVWKTVVVCLLSIAFFSFSVLDWASFWAWHAPPKGPVSKCLYYTTREGCSSCSWQACPEGTLEGQSPYSGGEENYPWKDEVRDDFNNEKRDHEGVGGAIWLGCWLCGLCFSSPGVALGAASAKGSRTGTSNAW